MIDFAQRNDSDPAERRAQAQNLLESRAPFALVLCRVRFFTYDEMLPYTQSGTPPTTPNNACGQRGPVAGGGSSMTPPRHTDRPFRAFGQMLREYRESYGERMRAKNPHLPRVRLTALALIEHLEDQYDIHLTSGAYSDIEQGVTLPRELQRFVDAVTACLGIEKNSLDYHRLIQQLAYDVVAWRAGPDIAQQTVPLVMNLSQLQSFNSDFERATPNGPES